MLSAPAIEQRSPGSIGARPASADPSGRLQVVECADDATGLRIFAVYDGLTVLRWCTTSEQSLAFMQGVLTGAPWLDSPADGKA